MTENEYTPTFKFAAECNHVLACETDGCGAEYLLNRFSISYCYSSGSAVDEQAQKQTRTVLSTPILNWEDVNHAVKYQIQLAKDDVFDFEVINIELISTMYLFQKPLENNQTYYWRIRSVDGDGDISIWSLPRYFRTKMESATLVSPANHEDVQTTRPTFTWLPVIGAKSYTLYISLDDTFTELTRYFTTVEPTFTPKEDLARDYTIYWRVVANGYNPSVSTSFDFAGASPHTSFDQSRK